MEHSHIHGLLLMNQCLISEYSMNSRSLFCLSYILIIDEQVKNKLKRSKNYNDFNRDMHANKQQTG